MASSWEPKKAGGDTRKAMHSTSSKTKNGGHQGEHPAKAEAVKQRQQASEGARGEGAVDAGFHDECCALGVRGQYQ